MSRIRNIKYLIITLCTFHALGIYGQVSFTAKAPGQVKIGQQFMIVYEVNQEGEGFKIPEINEFRFLQGPSISKSSSFSMSGGSVSQSFNVGYTFYYEAIKEGKFNIGPATIVIDGKKIQSNSLKIEVVKGSTKSSGGSAKQSKDAAIQGKNLFAKTYLSKKEVYVGEQILAKVKLFTKYDIRGADFNAPDYNGFYKQAIDNEAVLKPENVNGEAYRTAILQKVLLFPQQSGELEIGEGVVDLTIAVPDGNRRSFFGRVYKNVNKTVKSGIIKVKVKPLPEGKPSTFNGAVGNFKMEASIDQSEVKVNDAITLKVSVSGNGNIKLFEAPSFQFPPDFEIYEPKISQSVKNNNSGQSGSKTFEYLLIPRHSGEYRINPIKIHYFDTKTKKYSELSTRKFIIQVAKGDSEESPQMMTGITSKEDIQYLGQDIRFVKSDFEWREKDDYFFGSGIYFLLIFLILGSGAAFVVVYKKQNKKASDLKYVKNRRANKEAIKKLKTAQAYLGTAESEKFYDELSKGMWGYVSDKFDISGSDLSKDKVEEQLKKEGVSEELCGAFWELIDTSDMARYSNTSELGDKQSMYDEALNILSKIEQNLA